MTVRAENKIEEQHGALQRRPGANGSGAMFDGIATRYDMLNRLMSFGIDRSWRRALVDAMPNEGRILDLATGTADVALAIAKARPNAELIGLDPSVNMLDVGCQKVRKIGLDSRVTLLEGDAQAMPFEDNSFAGSCISFGIRNVPDRLLGLREMARVTQPGGPVVVLELSEPQGGLLGWPARFHVHYLVPFMGALISGRSEYRYLQRSIAAFPPAEDFAELMRCAGLKKVVARRLTFGAAYLYYSEA